MAAEEDVISQHKQVSTLGGFDCSAPALLQGLKPSERPMPPEFSEDCDGRTTEGASTLQPKLQISERSAPSPPRRRVSHSSFDQLLQGLIFQQEYLRSAQLHLQEMSSHLDTVIRGDLPQYTSGASRCGVVGTPPPPWGTADANQDASSPAHVAPLGNVPNAPMHPPSRMRTLFSQQPVPQARNMNMRRLGSRSRSFGSLPSGASGWGSHEKPMGKDSPQNTTPQNANNTAVAPKEKIEALQLDLPTGQFSGKELGGIMTKKSSRLQNLRNAGSAMGPASSLVSGTSPGSCELASRSYWFYHSDRASEDSDVMAVMSALNRGEDEHTQKLVARVKDRLGIRRSRDPAAKDNYVTSFRLYKTLQRLGARRYSVADCDMILATLADVAPNLLCPSFQEEIEQQSSQNEAMPFRDFAALMLMPEEQLFSRCNLKEDKIHDMILTMREILTSGDANRLVAELTQVNVDDLAKPPRVDRLAEMMEPIMSIVIVFNCIAIGWQANEHHDAYSDSSDAAGKWFWADCAFTVIFLIEIVLKLYNRGRRWFLLGPEQCWNAFDTLLVFLGIMDMIMTLTWKRSGGIAIFSVLRIIRLVRLGRLFRVFRMKKLKELSLMLVGVVAGMRTLLWAVVLLFATVYILGVFATLTLGGNPPEGLHSDVCADVPMAMFTVYRCLLADCNDEGGRSLVYMYADAFGAPFILGYVASTTFVVFGVFNLIFAIYIESTLAAAKCQRKMDRNESIRVARLARELLKKFAMAQTLLFQHDPDCRELYADSKEFRMKMRGATHGMQIKSAGDLLISRDTFTLALRDPEVQHLLDALDISSDRMHLFEILDADDSGDVEASELIRGLLRVRGEAKKSDVVANLLAVRAAQHMIRKVEHLQQEVLDSLRVNENGPMSSWKNS